MAPGMPAVPLKLVEKKWAGEFADFGELPPTKGRAKPVTGSFEGQLILVHVADLYQTNKLLPNLATWSQCFALFMATVALKDQKRIADLLTYMATIAKLAKNIAGCPGWSMTRIWQQAAESGTVTGQKLIPGSMPSVSMVWPSAMRDGANTAIPLNMRWKIVPHANGLRKQGLSSPTPHQALKKAGIGCKQ